MPATDFLCPECKRLCRSHCDTSPTCRWFTCVPCARVYDPESNRWCEASFKRPGG